MNDVTVDHVVLKYMDVFYRSHDFEALYGIFSRHLTFEGPLFQFDTAEAYINSLKASPSVNCDYEIIEEYVNENAVCLIYNIFKGSKKTLMAQTFLIEAGLITHIRLIFNAQAIM